ncbi:transglutaminase domain-containing protein [Actibacterium sp. D379-3]
MAIILEVTVAEAGAGRLFAPIGLMTPHLRPEAFVMEGAGYFLATEAQTGQWVAVLEGVTGPVRFCTSFAPGRAAYPDALFVHRPNRFTEAAEALVGAARATAQAAGGGQAGLQAIVNDVAAQFFYGHPEQRFSDGEDSIPALCGPTEGSCVDINAYLIASLRAAGYEAGYVTGYFFPEEKRGRCEDSHCWVVTRYDGVVQEWDIAHHLKMGTRKIAPGLNPKPGVRVPMAHSMGLDIPTLGLTGLKLLSQPMRLEADGRAHWAEVEITLRGYDALAALG